MLIEIRDLSVSFDVAQSVQAVNNVNLILFDGQKTAIIGETGSGKSVLLLAILKLLPGSTRVTGEVLYNGKNILKLTEKELRNVRGAQIAYVPQGSGNSLNPLLTVGMQIGEPLVQHRGYDKKEAFKESINLLQRFHIGMEEKRSKSYPHTYSGGMKQRALVAMGISAGARLILADEPTKGLDEEKIEQVKEAFLSLKEQAILCVTHDINFADEIAEYVGVMYASMLIEYGPKDKLLKKPLHPYTMDLINAMPENGLNISGSFAPSDTKNTEGCLYKLRCKYAEGQCDQIPPMIDLGENHKVRCWMYVNKN